MVYLRRTWSCAHPPFGGCPCVCFCRLCRFRERDERNRVQHGAKNAQFQVRVSVWPAPKERMLHAAAFAPTRIVCALCCCPPHPPPPPLGFDTASSLCAPPVAPSLAMRQEQIRSINTTFSHALYVSAVFFLLFVSVPKPVPQSNERPPVYRTSSLRRTRVHALTQQSTHAVSKMLRHTILSRLERTTTPDARATPPSRRTAAGTLASSKPSASRPWPAAQQRAVAKPGWRCPC